MNGIAGVQLVDLLARSFGLSRLRHDAADRVGDGCVIRLAGGMMRRGLWGTHVDSRVYSKGHATVLAWRY